MMTFSQTRFINSLFVAASIFALISCRHKSNRDNNNVHEEQDSIIASITSSEDSISTLQDSIICDTVDIPEEPEYRDVILSMDMVKLTFNPLDSFLRKYVVPSVKKNGFNKKNTFVTARVKTPEDATLYYFTDEEILLKEAVLSFNSGIKILEIWVTDCGVRAYADKIAEGKVKVAMVDDIPIMFINCANIFTKPASGKYVWGKYRFYRDLLDLRSCDMDCFWHFVLEGNKMYFFNFGDIGYSIPGPEEDYIPPVADIIQQQLDIIKNSRPSSEIPSETDSTTVPTDTIAYTEVTLPE